MWAVIDKLCLDTDLKGHHFYKHIGSTVEHVKNLKKVTFTWSVFCCKEVDAEGIWRHQADLESEKFVLGINEDVRCGCQNGWMNCCPKHTCWLTACHRLSKNYLDLSQINKKWWISDRNKHYNKKAWAAQVTLEVRQWNSGTENVCWHWQAKLWGLMLLERAQLGQWTLMIWNTNVSRGHRKWSPAVWLQKVLLGLALI